MLSLPELITKIKEELTLRERSHLRKEVKLVHLEISTIGQSPLPQLISPFFLKGTINYSYQKGNLKGRELINFYLILTLNKRLILVLPSPYNTATSLRQKRFIQTIIKIIQFQNFPCIRYETNPHFFDHNVVYEWYYSYRELSERLEELKKLEEKEKILITEPKTGL